MCFQCYRSAVTGVSVMRKRLWLYTLIIFFFYVEHWVIGEWLKMHHTSWPRRWWVMLVSRIQSLRQGVFFINIICTWKQIKQIYDLFHCQTSKYWKERCWRDLPNMFVGGNECKQRICWTEVHLYLHISCALHKVMYFYIGLFAFITCLSWLSKTADLEQAFMLWCNKK